MPAGRTVQSIVVYIDRSAHIRRRFVTYYFLKDGVKYEFQYFCPNVKSGTYVRVFDVSARSIRLSA